MKVLGFIPARAGSKGVPDKNIKPIKGIPLLEYSVFAATKAKQQGILQDVIVSTDSRHYLSYVNSYDIDQEYLRPYELATDTSPTIDAVLHVLDWYKNRHKKSYDAVMILQPTSPFRTAHNIAQAITLLENTPQASCVASICKLSDHHPMRIKRLEDSGRLMDFCSEHTEPEPSRRQDFFPEAFIRNGAIYLTTTKTLQKEHVIRGNWVAGLEMSQANSINVDEHIDFVLAKASLEYDIFSDDLAFFQELLIKKEFS